MRLRHTETPGSLIIFGAWYYSNVIAETAQDIGWTVTGFIDPDPPEKRLTTQNIPDDAAMIVAIGNNSQRAFVQRTLLKRGRNLVSIIHPTASVSKSATLGAGCYLAENTVVRTNSIVGMGTFLNSGVVVSHDCHIGDFVTFGPNAATGGYVKIGEETTLGVGANVRPGARIGCGCQVGAGAAVVSDIEDKVMAIGVPAQVAPLKPVVEKQSDWSCNKIW